MHFPKLIILKLTSRLFRFISRHGKKKLNGIFFIKIEDVIESNEITSRHAHAPHTRTSKVFISEYVLLLLIDFFPYIFYKFVLISFRFNPNNFPVLLFSNLLCNSQEVGVQKSAKHRSPQKILG